MFAPHSSLATMQEVAQIPSPYADSHLSVEGTERFYHLDEEELDFFTTVTGIKDEKALEAHIIAVQREAYKVRSHTLS